MSHSNREFCEVDSTNDLIVALIYCVRVFSFGQVAGGYFGGSRGKAEYHVTKLVAQGQLVSEQFLIRELPALQEPLYVWEPGRQPPNVQSIVATTRKRWSVVPAKLTTIYRAGPMSMRLFGGVFKKSLSHPLQASHDLGLAETYLAVRRDRPEVARFWFGEDVVPKQLGYVPDAIYIDEQGNTRIAFEFCGLYSAKRLQAFHRHCAKRRLCYELW